MRGKTGADREISVNTYTGGFTTMLNHHLRNRNLSLKAVGLLSKMLSLPPDWDYSIRGLAMLNTDGIDGIRTAMKELEEDISPVYFTYTCNKVGRSITTITFVSHSKQSHEIDDQKQNELPHLFSSI